MDFLLQNFDNIFKVSVVVFGAFGFYFALRSDISSLKKDLCHVKENQRGIAEAIAQVGRLLTSVAVQDARQNMFEKKLDELSHGHGFVINKVN